MKRFLVVGTVFFSVCSVFAYQDTDITTANSLASHNIIVDQSQTPEQYRLGDKILRQEVIGMALKIQGITPPENYTCKGYYLDTKQNDWVCRAIEIAADNGVIARGNKNANPERYITRAEALAILMNAGGLAGEITADDPPLADLEISYIFDEANSWQQEIIEKAAIRDIVDLRTMKTDTAGKDGEYGVTVHIWFRPNQDATRAEVFDFASKILTRGSLENIQSTFHFSDRDVMLTFKDTSQKTEMDEKYKKVKNIDMYISENPSGFDVIKIVDQKFFDSILQNKNSANPMSDGQGTESTEIHNILNTITIGGQEWLSLKANHKSMVTFTDGTQSGTESEYVQCFYKMNDGKYFASMTMQSGIDTDVDNCDFFSKYLASIQVVSK